MKKLLIISSVLLLGLTGCGSSEEKVKTWSCDDYIGFGSVEIEYNSNEILSIDAEMSDLDVVNEEVQNEYNGDVNAYIDAMTDVCNGEGDLFKDVEFAMLMLEYVFEEGYIVMDFGFIDGDFNKTFMSTDYTSKMVETAKNEGYGRDYFERYIEMLIEEQQELLDAGLYEGTGTEVTEIYLIEGVEIGRITLPAN